MHGTQHSESTKALVPLFFLSIVVPGDDTFSFSLMQSSAYIHFYIHNFGRCNE
jgi:hypothetical protein